MIWENQRKTNKKVSELSDKNESIKQGEDVQITMKLRDAHRLLDELIAEQGNEHMRRLLSLFPLCQENKCCFFSSVFLDSFILYSSNNKV